MSEIATSIFIAAKPDRIWKQLIGFNRFAEWNPFILSIDGQRGLGEKVLLKLRLATADGRMADRDISARIIKWEDEHEIRWGHGSWIPGWMDFEHWVRIAPCKGGANVHHCMRVSGLLAGLLRPDYFTMFESGFAAMNAALKDVVETQEAARPPAAVFANDNTGAPPRAPDDRRRAG